MELEFVLADVDISRCNVLVAQMVMYDEHPSTAVRSLVSEDRPSMSDYEEFAESFVREGDC